MVLPLCICTVWVLLHRAVDTKNMDAGSGKRLAYRCASRRHCTRSLCAGGPRLNCTAGHNAAVRFSVLSSVQPEENKRKNQGDNGPGKIRRTICDSDSSSAWHSRNPRE